MARGEALATGMRHPNRITHLHSLHCRIDQTHSSGDGGVAQNRVKSIARHVIPVVLGSRGPAGACPMGGIALIRVEPGAIDAIELTKKLEQFADARWQRFGKSGV